jgi:hypothetical protein
MNITEFAESRGVEPQAVNRYLLRHKDIKKTCVKKGKTIELSDEALELLEKQYPIPKPVQIIKGVPQEEYDKLLKMYAAAEKEIADIQSLRMEETKMLMETKEKLFQLEDKSREDLLKEKNRADSAEAEVARLKSRSLWQRILNS